MEDSTRPAPCNFFVKAHVSLFGWSNEPALTFFVDKVCFLIDKTFSSEYWPVHVDDFLQNFFAVLAHFLIHKLSNVQVVFHKFFDSSELDMLVQQLWGTQSLAH